MLSAILPQHLRIASLGTLAFHHRGLGRGRSVRRIILGVAAGVVLTLAGAPASAQYLKDRVGKACAGYFYETSEQRAKICSQIIDDPDRSAKSRAWAYAYRAGAYYEMRQRKQALADANQAVALWPEYAQGYVIRGTTLGDMGRRAEAVADLDKAISLGAGYAAYLGRGHVLYWMAEYDRALPDLDEALKRMPNSAAAYLARGNTYAAKGRYDDAVKDYTQGTKLAPHEPRFWLGRATIYAEIGKPDLARADLDRALRVSKDEKASAFAGVDRWMAIGSAMGLKDYDGALMALDEAVKRAPDNAEAYNARCWHRATAGRDLAEALADCTRALERGPDDPSILDSRGLVRFRSGDYRGAIADLDAALRASPKMAGSQYVRGLAKIRLGMTADGQADIDAAVAVRPGVAKVYAGYGLAP